jgi:chemotaxis signal transduction protein
MSLDAATNGQLGTTGAAEQQLLTFIVDGAEYAVDILRVQEIRIGCSMDRAQPSRPPE